MTDAYYVDDLTLLTNAPAQAEYLLHSLKQAARGIILYVNADKTGSMCFKQNGDTPTLSGKPLKLEDLFIYLGSNILSIESNVDICIRKA